MLRRVRQYLRPTRYTSKSNENEGCPRLWTCGLRLWDLWPNSLLAVLLLLIARPTALRKVSRRPNFRPNPLEDAISDLKQNYAREA